MNDQREKVKMSIFFFFSFLIEKGVAGEKSPNT